MTFVLTQEYILEFDTTSWGWIHLIGGVIVLFAGFGVFSGAVWGRTVASRCVGVIVADQRDAASRGSRTGRFGRS